MNNELIKTVIKIFKQEILKEDRFKEELKNGELKYDSIHKRKFLF